jgi:hypothetical protein
LRSLAQPAPQLGPNSRAESEVEDSHPTTGPAPRGAKLKAIRGRGRPRKALPAPETMSPNTRERRAFREEDPAPNAVDGDNDEQLRRLSRIGHRRNETRRSP